MSFIKNLIGGAVKGVKTLVQNAKVGKQATAAGFLQPQIIKQQQAETTAAVAKSSNVILIVVLSVVAFITLLIAIFKRK